VFIVGQAHACVVVVQRPGSDVAPAIVRRHSDCLHYYEPLPKTCPSSN
jgi:hypothetical protein